VHCRGGLFLEPRCCPASRALNLVEVRLTTTDYRETAAKLQKEWRVHQPHRQFEFASHVNTYALVSLLNKGLIYEDYQRQFTAATQEVWCLLAISQLPLILRPFNFLGLPSIPVGVAPGMELAGRCAGGGFWAQGGR
jgi:hypothetical protein